MSRHSDDDVVGTVIIDYRGTVITKTIGITSHDGATDAVNVVRLMESLSRHVNAMVQADQFARQPRRYVGKAPEEPEDQQA